MSDTKHMAGDREASPLPSPIADGDDEDGMLSPEEWRRLKAEWTHDYGLRRLEDRGVRYEDEADRRLDHAAEADGPLPSPGEIAQDDGLVATPRPDRGRGRGR